MEQKPLRMLSRIEGPDVVPASMLKLAKTYREAVRVCWQLRRAKGMKLTDMARMFGFTRQHVSDWLNPDDKPTRRSPPGDQIGAFEDACGNTFVTQWLASQARLTVLEEMQAERLAA